jgi:hypothetical protein
MFTDIEPGTLLYAFPPDAQAEIERLKEVLQMVLDYIDTGDMCPLDLRKARAALAGKEDV